MARLIAADASLLIAWLDDRDAHHEDAIAALADCDGFVVHEVTLAEVLVHPVRSGVDGKVLALLSAIGMTISTSDLDATRLARLRVEHRLKMPDCVVVACALAHDIPVVSFDQRLMEVASRLKS